MNDLGVSPAEGAVEKPSPLVAAGTTADNAPGEAWA
jgi:hypothetical protein